MIRIFGLKSRPEAEQRARELLYERIGKQTSASLLYVTSTLTYTKVADSFSNKPITPFDVPRENREEKDYYVTCIDKEDGKWVYVHVCVCVVCIYTCMLVCV